MKPFPHNLPRSLVCLHSILSVLVLSPCMAQTESSCPDAGRWRDLIEQHLRRYPAGNLDDVYKLVHQATLGTGHAIPSRAVASEWLDCEWAALSEGPDEPLIDTLGRRGVFARVHLRPFKASGGSRPELLEAFLHAAERRTSDTTDLLCALQALRELARANRCPWPVNEVEAYAAKKRELGYPAVRHSPAYEAAYKPAYRVIPVQDADRLGLPWRKAIP